MLRKIKSWPRAAAVGLICVITPRCQEMTRLISQDQETPISATMKLRMRWHYGICIWCKRYHDQIGLLGKLSRIFAEESCEHGAHQFTDDAKNRMKDALRRKAKD